MGEQNLWQGGYREKHSPYGIVLPTADIDVAIYLQVSSPPEYEAVRLYVPLGGV
jgi:hypothetical protein